MKFFRHKSFAVHLPFLFLLFLFVGCAQNEARSSSAYLKSEASLQAGQFNKGILWKVSKQGATPSYVFGTVHSEDERVTNLPDEINDAFTAADIFLLEMILDDKNSKAIMREMYFNDGRNLKSLVSIDLYTSAVNAMKKKGLPEHLVNIMKPWAIFTVLNMPDQKTGLFLDAVLYQSAIKHNKHVIGLESMKEQLAVFDEMSLETQLSLLKSSLESGEDMDKILDEIIEIYLTHDLQKILELNDSYIELLDKDIAEIFNQRLIVDRNKRMVERMLSSIDKGNAFIAIGALHLPGENGVLSLLIQKGYSVSAVY